MYWNGGDVNGWEYAVMAIGMFAFWGLVIAGVVYLIRQPDRVSRTGAALSAPRAPEQLLAERFARGEIDEGEYRNRLSILRDHVRL